MNYYIIQVFGLLLLFYFLGAWIGCTLRSLHAFRVERERWYTAGAAATAASASSEMLSESETSEAVASEASPAADVAETVQSNVVETQDTFAEDPEEVQDADEDDQVEEVSETFEDSDSQPAIEDVTAEDAGEPAPSDTSEVKEDAPEIAESVAAEALAATAADSEPAIEDVTAKDAGEPAPSDTSDVEVKIPEIAESVAVAAVAATAALAQSSEREEVSAAQPVGDDLKRIKGVSSVISDLLTSMGITSYEQIANWTTEDVARINRELDSTGRVERENWIEQAKILAAGGTTAFARELDEGILSGTQGKTIERSATLPPSENDAKQRKIDEHSDVNQTGEEENNTTSVPKVAVATAAGAAMATITSNTEEQGPSSEPETTTNTSSDDLTRIKGIDGAIAEQLSALGITSYEQIANWTPADVTGINQELDSTGRVERENWIEQAKILAVGGTTEFARNRDGE